MPNAIRSIFPVLRFAQVLAVAAAVLPAGDLDGYFSNQSADGPVTLVLDEAGANRGDVYFSLLNRPPDRSPRRAPVLFQRDCRSQTLAPGQTAVLHLLAPPVAGSHVCRAFQVRQEGRAGTFGFTLRVALMNGLPYAEMRPDPGAENHADLTQADPDLLVFWGFGPAEGREAAPGPAAGDF